MATKKTPTQSSTPNTSKKREPADKELLEAFAHMGNALWLSSVVITSLLGVAADKKAPKSDRSAALRVLRRALNAYRSERQVLAIRQAIGEI